MPGLKALSPRPRASRRRNRDQKDEQRACAEAADLIRMVRSMKNRLAKTWAYQKHPMKQHISICICEGEGSDIAASSTQSIYR